MVEFDVLGTDREIDAGDPVGSAWNLGMLILGAAALFVVLPVGQQVADWVMTKASAAAGTEVGGTDAGVSFGSPE